MGIKDCYRETRKSTKSGKDYTVLVLCFENGYKLDTFLTNEQNFILKDVVPEVQNYETPNKF